MLAGTVGRKAARRATFRERILSTYLKLYVIKPSCIGTLGNTKMSSSFIGRFIKFNSVSLLARKQEQPKLGVKHHLTDAKTRLPGELAHR